MEDTLVTIDLNRYYLDYRNNFIDCVTLLDWTNQIKNTELKKELGNVLTTFMAESIMLSSDYSQKELETYKNFLKLIIDSLFFIKGRFTYHIWTRYISLDRFQIRQKRS